jgi:hypothetical protein
MAKRRLKVVRDGNHIYLVCPQCGFFGSTSDEDEEGNTVTEHVVSVTNMSQYDGHEFMARCARSSCRWTGKVRLAENGEPI